MGFKLLYVHMCGCAMAILWIVQIHTIIKLPINSFFFLLLFYKDFIGKGGRCLFVIYLMEFNVNGIVGSSWKIIVCEIIYCGG